MNPENLIQVGKLYNPHSLKGELNVSFEAFFMGHINNAKFIFVKDASNLIVPIPVESINVPNNGKAIIKLMGIDSREAALKYQSRDIYIDKTMYENIDEDIENNVSELDYFIGFEIYDKGNPKLIGVIDSVIEMSTQLLGIVKVNGEELMIPIHNELIVEFDEENKKLILDLPEGLFDL